jgi:hypothetical protein
MAQPADSCLSRTRFGAGVPTWYDDVHDPDLPGTRRACTPAVRSDDRSQFLAHPLKLLGGQPEVSVVQTAASRHSSGSAWPAEEPLSS